MSRARLVRKQARAIKFAALRAQGLTQIEAWRQITPNWSELPAASQHARASEFASDPVVRHKVEQVLQEANLAAFMSGPRYAARVQDAIERALDGDAPNLTAAMAGLRLLGQTTNNLRETFSVTDDRGVTPEQLVSRIAALRPDLAAFAATALGISAASGPDKDSEAAVIPAKSLN